jgi:hypothetical protein
MRITRALCMLALSACVGPCAQETQAPAEPEATPTPRATPMPDAEAVYSFEVFPAEGTPSGTRMLEDGRVQVRSGTGWAEDHPLSPEAVARVLQMLEADAMGDLPRQLPVMDGVPETAPRAVWRFRHKGKERSVEAPRYSGIRVPQLEAVHRALGQGRVRPKITTRWTVGLDDPKVIDLPCTPLETTALRKVTSKLLSRDYPPGAAEALGTEWVRIDWHDDQTTWSTVLYEDGRLARVRPDGGKNVYTVPQDIVDTLQLELAEIVWDDPQAICRKRH